MRRAVSSGKLARASLTARAQVGVFVVDHALVADQVELGRGRGNFDPGLLAEDDQPGEVVLPPLLGCFGDVVECELLLIGGHAVGDVEQEDRGQAV